ncbi:MAG: Fic family protein [Chlamydiia bacterium]|nr:Fic family protein [Chlamydiia bacterium]
MPWNWELPDWPHFQCDFDQIKEMEKEFLLELGRASAYLKCLDESDSNQFIVEMLSLEGLESSRIEGEILSRESLQSSIKKEFGLNDNMKREKKKESQMAKLLIDVYKTFDLPLTHEMLWKWHAILFDEKGSGKYRSHQEPMQIVSNRYDARKVYFEAPPSSRVKEEMTRFIKWFSASFDSKSILGRAAMAHVYFESIHPFEDGNGRIGRILVEKIFSQGIGQPVLIAISKVLENQKKMYYKELGRCNRSLNIQDWVQFFASAALQAQRESVAFLYFLIEKSKILTSLSGKMNGRQEKVLVRMFAEGPAGFKGGLSAENYIAITKASRATATRDLADLVKKRALVKTGEFRHTRYWLNLHRL